MDSSTLYNKLPTVMPPQNYTNLPFVNASMTKPTFAGRLVDDHGILHIKTLDIKNVNTLSYAS
jgi:hypothetical protein